MPEIKQPRKVRPVLLITALIIAEVVAAFEGGTIWAAARVLQELFGDSVKVGWVIAAYFLVAGGAAVIGSRMGDLFGRRRVLIWVLLIAGFGSLVCALFHESYFMLLIGRGIQGTSAAILPLCYGLARESMPEGKVMPAIGLLAGTIGVATGIGLLLGGVMVDYFQWYWIFHLSVILALIAVVAVLAWVPQSRPSHDGSAIDILGGVLFPPGIILVLFSITQARYWGWDDGRIWGLLLGGIALLTYWVLYELRHRNPLVNVRFMMNRRVALPLLCMILSCATFQTTLVISLLVQTPVWAGFGLGLGASVVGAMSLASQIVGMAGGLWAAALIRRESARYTIILGGTILTGTWAGMALCFALGYASLPLLAACFLSYGIGSTIIFAVVPMAVMEMAPPERTSEATGVVSVVRQVFFGIFTQVVSVILALSVVSNPSQSSQVYPSQMAFTMAAAFMAGCAALIMVTALWLPGRKTRA